MKVDAINFEMRLALELKPNNPRAIANGTRRLQQYLVQLDLEYPTGPGQTPWEGQVVTCERR